MNNEELTITLKISQFLKYILGSLENIQIEKEEAKVLALLNIPSIHIQFNDLENGKELQKPILWWQKWWQKDLQKRQQEKRNSELQRLATLKNSSNITKTIKWFM